MSREQSPDEDLYRTPVHNQTPARRDSVLSTVRLLLESEAIRATTPDGVYRRLLEGMAAEITERGYLGLIESLRDLPSLHKVRLVGLRQTQLVADDQHVLGVLLLLRIREVEAACDRRRSIDDDHLVVGD